MWIRSVGLGLRQHDRFSHDRGHLTPLVGGTRSELLFGKDHVSTQQLSIGLYLNRMFIQ